jgi:DNA adenine methylase
MKYMGSKVKISKELLSIILKDRKENQWYVEPFCGGLGTFDKVSGNRIASDKNKYLIAMWKGLQENREKPMEISKELYSRARIEYNNNTNIEFDDFLIGWIGWMGSFNGRFFDGGYSGKTDTRDYINEQIRNTLKQVKSLEGAIFICKDFLELEIPENSIIYCDIPYKNTKKYSTSKNFDYNRFWQWCRDMSKKGHEVFISEYQAPDDFTCIWSKEVTNSMNTKLTYKPTEKLFIYDKKLKKSSKTFGLDLIKNLSKIVNVI